MGREKETAKFVEFLEGNEEIRILNLYGIGGMGKSTLLDRFRRLALASGAIFLLIDSRDFLHSPIELTRFISKQLFNGKQQGGELQEEEITHLIMNMNDLAQNTKLVLAFDTFEEMVDLEWWLRETLFTQLNSGVKLVVSGKYELKGAWISSPAWRRVILRMPIGMLEAVSVQEYLHKLGFTEQSQINRIAKRTIGHPLTLSLAAYYYQTQSDDRKLDLTNEFELTSTLAGFWLREVPKELRELTEAAVVLRFFNKEMLSTVLDRPIDSEAFDMLTRLSFVRLTERGWMFHDLMREAVLKQVQLHSPSRFRQLESKTIRYYFHKIIRSDRRENLGWEMSELFYYLGGSIIRGFLRNTDASLLYIEPLTKENLADAEAYLARRLKTDQRADISIRDPHSGEEIDFLMSADEDIQAIIGVDFQELLDLDSDTVTLYRFSDGEIAGYSAIVPIHSGTLDYLKTMPFSRPFFQSRTPEQLEEFNVPKSKMAGWWIRSVDFEKHTDPQVIYTGFHNLFTLPLKGGLIGTSPAPQRVRHDAHLAMGYEVVPGVSHCHYDGVTPTPTLILDARGGKLELFLKKMITSLGLEEDQAEPLSMERTLKLSAREREVVQLVVKGLTNAEIASRLYVGEITIKKHLTSIFKKMGVKNRAALVKVMLE